MKKVMAVVMLMLLISGMCFASDTISKRVYSYNIENTTQGSVTHAVPITSIRPKVDKLIGYSAYPADGISNSECYIAIFDGTSTLTFGEVLAESEAVTLKYINELWSFGKWINEGLVVRQGANTNVIVYFVKE